MKQEIEIMRHGLTPAAFLAYIRYKLKTKGMQDLASDLSLEYFRRGNDLNLSYQTRRKTPCLSCGDIRRKKLILCSPNR